jgi:hypothetical protein
MYGIKRAQFYNWAFLFFVSILLTSCTSRLEYAQSLLLPTYQQHVFQTEYFNIHSFYKADKASASAHIYIEGDGFAWHNKHQPSEDPTPKKPIALKMALTDTAPSVFYLARPCQYSWSKECDVNYWTEGRFNKKVVKSFLQALETIERNYGITNFKLFGFSGGGVVATALAQEKKNISHLTTIASPLNHKEWTEWHKVTPLNNSIPTPFLHERLSHAEQLHICGGKDVIVPCHLTKSFVAQLNLSIESYLEVKKNSHQCCWDEEWPRILGLLKKTSSSIDVLE